MSAQALEPRVRRMADAIKHRGPDDEGFWTDADHGAALGFRRLAIIDLTPTGRQPMVSASGRYTIAFNGEVYNFPDLRRELEAAGATFRGTSDTEVILAAFDRWGIVASLARFIGMFAMAVWDGREKSMWLARDRMGEKPLYYGRAGDALVFGSELKALRAHPGFEASIDRSALVSFLSYGYVPGPRSIYEGISKLAPGHYVTIVDGLAGAPQAYWSLAEVARRGESDPIALGEEAAADELESRLRAAVKRCMISDVPLGVFLSGGVDSSTVVALMQAQTAQPVHTFTIGFEEAAYNEAQDAAAVAAHLGTHHTQLMVTAEEARTVIPLLPPLYDEPFADASQIPTYLVSKLARAHVTVALSGDGGDEVFGGYNRYFLASGTVGRLVSLPTPLRRGIGALLRWVPARLWDWTLGWFFRSSVRGGTFGAKVHKVAAMMGDRGPDARYHSLVTIWPEAHRLVLGGAKQDRDRAEARVRDPVHRMMLLDSLSYLPDDILVKVDRASMGVSLETRAPFLNHDVVEFAWRLPREQKVQGGDGKRILKRVLYRHVPRALVDRPKMGFGVPIAEWLRGPLRAWAEPLLATERLRREGFFDPEPIQRAWTEHVSGRRNWASQLWCVLMFQAWLEDQHGAGGA